VGARGKKKKKVVWTRAISSPLKKNKTGKRGEKNRNIGGVGPNHKRKKIMGGRGVNETGKSIVSQRSVEGICTGGVDRPTM